MNEMKNLNEIADKVKDVEDGVTNLIIPILKDTIADSNRHNKRLFIMNICLLVSMFIIALFSQVLVAYQNQKYAEFLSQFEFETTTYQDFDTSDSSTIFNPIINN